MIILEIDNHDILKELYNTYDQDSEGDLGILARSFGGLNLDHNGYSYDAYDYDLNNLDMGLQGSIEDFRLNGVIFGF